MPKVVDRDAIRAEIADALLRVLAERGIDAISVRTVASAAGRSPGAVQKYFATKEEMLTAALARYCDRAGARIDAVDVGEPVDTVTALVAATLPLDVPSRLDALVLHEFAVRSAREQPLAAQLRAVDRDVAAGLVELLDDYVRAGRLRAELDTRAATSAVFALGDGLAMRMLYTPDERKSLLSTLRTGVAALLA